MLPYHDFVIPKSTCIEVIQWQGKEMPNLRRIALRAFTMTLKDSTTPLKTYFVIAMKCVLRFMDFHLLAEYTTHTIKTWNYMDGYLKAFHSYTNIFLEY